MAFLLDSHPDVVSVGETTPNRKIQRQGTNDFTCSCGTQIVNCDFWKELSDRIQSSGTRFSLETWDNEYLYRNELLNKVIRADTTHPIARKFLDLADHWLPFHRSHISRANRANVEYIRQALAISGAKAFFDTSKGIARLRRLITCPQLDVRIIHFTRDVRAFAFHGKRNDVPIEAMSRRWLAFHENAKRFFSGLDQKQVITVKYEDLCQDPARWLGTIHEHMGLAAAPPPRTLKSADHHIIGNRMRLVGDFNIQLNEKWREGLSPQEMDVALRIGGRMNQALGYACGEKQPLAVI
jgi:hypothetical protein